ncbi:MAG: hypothetical protein JXC32_06885 [Anaerolineae bacterium]|nr:hypothetical protein [Anaerolineae bacterium]
MADQTEGTPSPELTATVSDGPEAMEACHWHPKVETALRCYQCGTPICVKCARRTPVGYICPDCQRGRKRRFEQASRTDYVLAAVVAVILGGLAGILPLLGSWWFLLFLSPLAGTAIAEIVWRAVGRRYGQHLWWIVSAGIVIGGLPVLGLGLLQSLALLQGSIWGLQGLLSWGLHIILAIGTATARLRLT